MVFPLDYTIADAEDILSPGNYLLDAVDKAGEPLGVTIGLSLGMPRNAESIEPDNDNDAPAVVPTTLPSTTSDVRLVLEANVRATQMAFLHNQRTLEIGLRMAETLRDSVQVLASSQADWIKSLSSARGVFRHTAQPLPPVEVKQLTVQTGGSDDEDDDEDDDRDDMASGAAATPAHWSEPFVPIIHSVVQQVGPAIMAWAAKQPTGGHAASGNGSEAAHREKQAAEKQAADEQAAQAADAEHAAKLRSAIAAASSPGSGINVIKLMQMLPQRTVTKFMQLQAALSPDEQADALQIFQGYGADGLEELLRLFDAASLEQATDFLRRLIGDRRRMQAVKRAARTEAPPSGGSTSETSGSGSAEPR